MHKFKAGSVAANGLRFDYLEAVRCTLNPALQSPGLAATREGIAMAAIHVPALMFHGANDGCIGVDLVAGMEAFCPKGLQLEVVSGAGHFAHQERPDVVSPTLLAFLGT